MAINFKDKFNQLSDAANLSADKLSSGVSKLANRIVDKQVCIGITGFSGSGKSTFITSLIHQLNYSNEAALSGFLPARDNKILSVKLKRLPGMKLFDYEQGITALSADKPEWPNPTTEISGCMVSISYKRDSIFKSVIGKTTRLNIEMRDYPGEWLLDIPLLKHNFYQWSMESTSLLNQPERKQLLGPLFEQLESLDPLSVLSANEIEAIANQYAQFLARCKTQDFTLIQPGRMLLPSPEAFEPFFPLINMKGIALEALENADNNSLYKVLKYRYEHYLKQIVEPFYRSFFKGVDRQLILIDSLKALSSGKTKFDEMMLAFSRIIDSYKTGTGNLLTKLIAPKVEKIVFLASKPDRVLMSQHENLRYLTDNIVKRICKQSIRNVIKIETEIACAVRCTEDHDQYLLGSTLTGQKGRISHPLIPEDIPNSTEEWAKYKDWTPIVLQPPLMTDLKLGGRIPCIRMDKVLKELIGDKFE